MVVLQASDGSRRFRYVLACATIRNTLHFELSGRYFDELFQGDILARNEAAYRAVIGGRGEHAIQRWEQRGRPVIRFRRLLLPLASDPRRIASVLGARNSGVSGTSVSVRVDHGGRRFSKK